MPATQSVDPSVSRTPLPLNAESLPTICVLCSHNCGLRVDVKDGRIAKVRADESNPISKGYLCNKAFSIAHYVEHAQRTQHPLKRRADGSFERIGWDQAIAEIAEKLNEIRRKHSPRAIALVGIGGQANHMDGPFGLSWLGGVGSKLWFNALAQEKTQHFLMNQWMFDLPPSAWFEPDLQNAQHLLVFGTNPRISNRGPNPNETFRDLAEDPNRTVVVIDPRETETTRQADRHLRAKPGSDAFILLALTALVSRGEGLVDAEFIRERTRDFEALRAALSEIDIDEMARRCGLTREELETTARDFATADSAAIMQDLAVEHLPYSTLISYLIRVLSSLTGNVAKHGGNTFVETAAPLEWNPKRFEEPVRTLESGIRGISAMGGFPMFSPTLAPEEVLGNHPERLRAMVVEAANPMLTFSDTSRWREARERLDLLVVIDPAMTETAQVADYVLPTPTGYEKWEIAGFPKRHPEIHVQLRPPVVPGPPDALPEPEIYARLVEAMELIPEPPQAMRDLAANALTPEGAAALLGVAQSEAQGDQTRMLFWAYRTLGEHLPSPALVAVWVQAHSNAFLRRDAVVRTLGEDWKGSNPFELAHEVFRRILDHPEGVEIACMDETRAFEDHVGWDDKRIRLAPEAMLEEIARANANDLPTDPNFPLVLAAGLRTRWTANTIQRDPKWRKGRGPHCPLFLSPQDAETLGIVTGDRVRLSTRRGSLELPASVDTKLRAGHVWVPNGFGTKYPKNGEADGALEEIGVNLNELTDVNDRDPITGCPEHKYTLCRVERL